MKLRVILLALAGLWSLPGYAGDLPPTVAAEPAGRLCTGAYADDLQALAPQVLAYERRPNAQSASYCLRSAAVFECLSYGSDGSIRRTRKTARAHGTVFGYQEKNGETLLLTNDHVVSWPEVTGEGGAVGDVPAGCKRVSTSLQIVDSEADAFAKDDLPLSVVVSDDRLDVAVVRAKTKLPVLPWRVGRSSLLRERNVVDVRGFPLGAFAATSVGKVVSALDHDEEGPWEHEDFVVDALLSPGNSGSPVLAVSCTTGEFELVGIYHAVYSHGSALNVVVSIDQVRELMTTLEKPKRPKTSARSSDPVAADRARLRKLAEGQEPFFPFGRFTAAWRPRSDGSQVFVLYPKEFPLVASPVAMIEDLPSQAPGDYGQLGRVWFGSTGGLRAWSRRQLESEVQSQVGRLLDGLRASVLQTFAWRRQSKIAQSSREAFERNTRYRRELDRRAGDNESLAELAVELSERLGPAAGQVGITMADALEQREPNPAFPIATAADAQTLSTP